MHTFADTNLTPDQLAFTNKILDSDALAAQVITRIRRKESCSCIRMSDGERGFIHLAQTGEASWFIRDPSWIAEYGLKDADYRAVGFGLLDAGVIADYCACTISGVYWPEFDVQKYFPHRQQYISSFYVRAWNHNGIWPSVLKHAPVIILHRNHAQLVPRLRQLYPTVQFTGFTLGSWTDQAPVERFLKNMEYSTVLVSGGPSSKAWIPGLAINTGHCVLDVGAGLQSELIERPCKG